MQLDCGLLLIIYHRGLKEYQAKNPTCFGGLHCNSSSSSNGYRKPYYMQCLKFQKYGLHERALTPLKYLKTVYTIGNCQRPVSSLGISQHMHKITNLCKFELDRSSELRDNYERKKHPCHTKKIVGKLLLSPKLRHFRGSRFSQCFILSTSPHYSLPSKVL